jgi:hypothetical protein
MIRAFRLVVILACTLAISVIIHRNSGERGQWLVDATVGDRVCRQGGKPWAPEGSKAFVIVTSPICGACRLSKDFSDELYAYGKRNGIPVFYVVGERSSLDLGAHEIASTGAFVLRANLSRFGIMQEPTFLRVSSEGIVESRWFGTVPAGRRKDVLNSITEGTSLESYQRAPASEFDQLLKSERIQLIALSEHGRPGSKLIPLNELDARWRYELNPNLRTLLDCSTAQIPVQCEDAAILLSKSGFNDVVAVGLPKRPTACAM